MDRQGDVTKLKELILPKEIKQDVNPLSGYINSDSRFYKKSTKGLFMSKENIRYLEVETLSMLTFFPYVESVLLKSKETYSGNRAEVSRYIKEFDKNDSRVYTFVQATVFDHKLPYPEESLHKNPIILLHNINRDFIFDTSRNLILSPDCIIHDFYDTDPLTGQNYFKNGGGAGLGNGDWDYGVASYSDGTWHPEHLFTECRANRGITYWTPGEVTFDTDPPGQPFHPRENHYHLNSRTKRSVLSGIGPGPGPGNKYKYDSYTPGGFKLSEGLFPRWQHPAQYLRLGHRNIDEGLHDGGRGDRRVQTNRKYDLSHLLSKSTY